MKPIEKQNETNTIVRILNVKVPPKPKLCKLKTMRITTTTTNKNTIPTRTHRKKRRGEKMPTIAHNHVTRACAPVTNDNTLPPPPLSLHPLLFCTTTKRLLLQNKHAHHLSNPRTKKKQNPVQARPPPLRAVTFKPAAAAHRLLSDSLSLCFSFSLCFSSV